MTGPALSRMNSGIMLARTILDFGPPGTPGDFVGSMVFWSFSSDGLSRTVHAGVRVWQCQNFMKQD